LHQGLVDWLGRLGRGSLQRAPLRSAATMVIDERVAQQAIEPRRRGLSAAQRVATRNRTNERLLQDLLGRLTRPDPALEKHQKARVALDELSQDLRRHAGRLRVGLRSLRLFRHRAPPLG
jgi:hypothetical protein